MCDLIDCLFVKSESLFRWISIEKKNESIINCLIPYGHIVQNDSKIEIVLRWISSFKFSKKKVIKKIITIENTIN